jgi:hypothetical protein
MSSKRLAFSTLEMLKRLQVFPYFVTIIVDFNDKDQGSRIGWSFRKRLRLEEKSPFSAYSWSVEK